MIGPAQSAVHVGDRIRVRVLPPGTWASSMAGQEGEVERSDPDGHLLVRMDGEPRGGVLAWLETREIEVVERAAEREEPIG